MRRSDFWIGAAAAGLGAILGSLPVLANGFVNWDDQAIILSNPHLIRPLASELRWMLSGVYLTGYQPLVWLCFWVVVRLQGLNPLGFHLLSLLCHGLNAVLLYALTIKLTRSSPTAALVSTLLFFLHPINVEPVAWAAEFGGLLSTSFFLGSIIAYVSAPEKQRAPGLAASWLCFLASALTRWRGIALPVVLLALDYYPLRRLRGRARAAIFEKIPFALVSLLMAAANWKAKTVGYHYAPSLQPIEAAAALLLYPVKLLFPAHLIPLYAITRWSNPLGLPGWACLVIVPAAAAACWLGRERAPGVAVAAVVFAASLAPVIAASTGGPLLVCDKYAYLSCLGAPILLAAMLKRSKTATTLAALLLLPLLAALSVRQQRYWHDSEALWRHAIEVDPASYVAHANLGVALYRAGRINEGMAEFREHLRLHPEDQAAQDAYLAIARETEKSRSK